MLANQPPENARDIWFALRMVLLWQKAVGIGANAVKLVAGQVFYLGWDARCMCGILRSCWQRWSGWRKRLPALLPKAAAIFPESLYEMLMETETVTFPPLQRKVIVSFSLSFSFWQFTCTET